jgi:hypothetical protein
MIERMKGQTASQAIRSSQRTDMDIKNHSNEVDPEGRRITFSMRQVLTSAARNNGGVFAVDRGESKLQQALNAENGNKLYEIFTSLLEELAEKPAERAMIELAERVQKLNFPENRQFNGLYEEYKASGNGLEEFLNRIMQNGKPNEGMIPVAELRREIVEIYGRQSPFLSAELKRAAETNQRRRSSRGGSRRGAEASGLAACRSFMLGLIR